MVLRRKRAEPRLMTAPTRAEGLSNSTLGRSGEAGDHANRITVIFGVSSSQAYQLAVNTAQKFDTYEQTGSGKSTTHRVTFTLEQIDSLRQMLDLVGRWKTTRVEIDGRPVLLKDIAPALQCYSESCRAYDPEEYCHGKDDASSYNDNDLGCRHCGVNPYSWQGLTEFGRMLRNGNFAVDKSKLIHTVFQNLEPYTVCPRLDLVEIRRKLESIPDRIDPRIHKDWEYITDYENGKEIAFGVRKRDPRRDTGYVLNARDDQTSSTTTTSIDRDTTQNEVKTKPQSKKRGRRLLGCLLWIAIVLGLLAIIGALTGQPAVGP